MLKHGQNNPFYNRVSTQHICTLKKGRLSVDIMISCSSQVPPEKRAIVLRVRHFESLDDSVPLVSEGVLIYTRQLGDNKAADSIRCTLLHTDIHQVFVDGFLY